MAPTRTIAASLLSFLPLTLLPTTALAQTSNSDFNDAYNSAQDDYNSAKKTVTAGQIAMIVILVVLGVFGIGSGIAFCCVLSRNKKKRARQAQEVKIANQRAAERRAHERGGYEAAPQQEEGLRPYQYGPASYAAPSEMDAYQPPIEVDSRAKSEMP